nr:MAG TPA: hypothetical protein [Caudoviricetes sp.]DAQ81303.1 MAG TPA: hypothetical protein [Caudoviricetes sp.]
MPRHPCHKVTGLCRRNGVSLAGCNITIAFSAIESKPHI